MKHLPALLLLLISSVCLAADEPTPKPTTVREMILACPQSERGPENGKGWKEIHYQRLAAWMKSHWIDQDVVVRVVVTSVRANKDGVMMVLSHSDEPAGKVFGIQMNAHPFTLMVDRDDEAAFLELKPNAKATVSGKVSYAGWAWWKNQYDRGNASFKLESAKIIAPAKK